MNPNQEDALVLALIACSLGVLVCRAEAASKRPAGGARTSHEAGVDVRFWMRLAWLFGVGAALVGSWWALFRLAQP